MKHTNLDHLLSIESDELQQQLETSISSGFRADVLKAEQELTNYLDAPIGRFNRRGYWECLPNKLALLAITGPLWIGPAIYNGRLIGWLIAIVTCLLVIITTIIQENRTILLSPEADLLDRFQNVDTLVMDYQARDDEIWGAIKRKGVYRAEGLFPYHTGKVRESLTYNYKVKICQGTTIDPDHALGAHQSWDSLISTYNQELQAANREALARVYNSYSSQGKLTPYLSRRLARLARKSQTDAQMLAARMTVSG